MSDIEKNQEAVTIIKSREKTIIQTSILGIVANVFLSVFKAIVGSKANSVAIISDAVNNLTDALSSVITIIGTKLAGKAPSKNHPMGYGRIEYFSAFIVSAIVLYAGITTVIDSVKKIIHPEDVDYSLVSLIVLAAAVVIKLILGIYTKKKGKLVNSGSLVASGQDAFQDAIISASVLVSAGIYLLWGIKLEAYVGAIIGLFIIKSGIELIIESINNMLGRRADSALSKALKSTIAKEPEVRGVYDLFINNFGPDKNLASAHVEVDENMTAREIDALTRRVQVSVFREHGVILLALGIYSYNTGDSEAVQIRQTIRRIVLSHEGILQFHGFYVDTEARTLVFDIVVDFSVKDPVQLKEVIRNEILREYPDYEIHIILDTDLSD